MIFGNGMINTGSRINFYFIMPCRLPARKKLKAFIELVFKKEGFFLGDLSFIFCEDSFLLGLNQRFLKHDYYTDILSFPISTGKSKTISGEIYISVDRVRENARAFDKPFQQEMHRVIFHGVLHLCRYKDKSKKARENMTSLEDKYLKRYFTRST